MQSECGANIRTRLLLPSERIELSTPGLRDQCSNP